MGTHLSSGQASSRDSASSGVSLELPGITDFKLEGLSILNANTVSISNDNDFGIGDNPGRPSQVWQIRLGTQLR